MLHGKLKDYHIILASNSPRRKQLLESLDIEFSVYTDFQVDESYPNHLDGEAISLYLAEKKSAGYPKELNHREILITADTIVEQSGEVLLKPESEEDARKILKKISGSKHNVYTGVCLRSALQKESFVSGTEVMFDSLSDEEIDYYIQNYKPYDKAGAYGIQEWIGFVGVEEIKGSYFNVMGLPVHRLYRELEKFLNQETK